MAATFRSARSSATSISHLATNESPDELGTISPTPRSNFFCRRWPISNRRCFSILREMNERQRRVHRRFIGVAGMGRRGWER